MCSMVSIKMLAWSYRPQRLTFLSTSGNMFLNTLCMSPNFPLFVIISVILFTPIFPTGTRMSVVEPIVISVISVSNRGKRTFFAVLVVESLQIYLKISLIAHAEFRAPKPIDAVRNKNVRKFGFMLVEGYFEILCQLSRLRTGLET